MEYLLCPGNQSIIYVLIYLIFIQTTLKCGYCYYSYFIDEKTGPESCQVHQLESGSAEVWS